MYGRVATNIRPPSDTMVYRVSVEVAPGKFRELLSSQVYSFRSGAQAAIVAGSAQDVPNIQGVARSPDPMSTDQPEALAVSEHQLIRVCLCGSYLQCN